MKNYSDEKNLKGKKENDDTKDLSILSRDGKISDDVDNPTAKYIYKFAYRLKENKEKCAEGDISNLLGDGKISDNVDNPTSEYWTATIVPEERNEILKILYQEGKLFKSGIIVTDRYPTNLVDEGTEMMFEHLHQNDMLEYESVRYYFGGMISDQFDEFEYEGKKYVRVVCTCNCPGNYMSDKRAIKAGDVRYINVEPITLDNTYTSGKSR